MRQTEQLQAIQMFAEKVLKLDKTGHDMTHIQRVVKLAEIIGKTESTTDQFIIEATAWLHDTYDEKLFNDPLVAKQRVVSFLDEIEVLPSQQTAILYIIDNMSWSKMLTNQAKPLDINGKIVQDADRLDAIGAIAIARTIMYGVKHDTPLFDSSIPPRSKMDKHAYRATTKTTIINHFDEKLLKIKDHLNTAEAKKIGALRHQLMLTYVQAFKAEWQLAES